MWTRHCPDLYEGPCWLRPCARFESGDEAPWMTDAERADAIGDALAKIMAHGRAQGDTPHPDPNGQPG